ncbi:hypothetical protein LTR36_006546 [Oleoguttula mirabilis]|uniref:Uncharacterized protein n=1 Tax=Oleoguttula mirabilis TaxID=1507867 RepID=A0AAV9JVD0_9PEZI|nr:hypothetical protein LTR36_006546 [Oleoguttula mirabilis]
MFLKMLDARPELELQTTLIFYVSLVCNILILLAWCGVFSPTQLLRATLRRPQAFCDAVFAAVRRFFPAFAETDRTAVADTTQAIPTAPGNCSPDDEDGNYGALWIDIKDYGRYMWYRVKRSLRFRPAVPVYVGEVKRAERAKRDRVESRLRLRTERRKQAEAEEKWAQSMVAERKREDAQERRRTNVFMDAGWL